MANDVSREDEEFLASEAVTYASVHGLNMLASADNAYKFIHAPLCLFPESFPTKLFSLAVQLAPIYNKLVDNISRDTTGWIENTLRNTVQSDSFTSRLLDLYLSVKTSSDSSSTPLQLYSLGLHRSDYMNDNLTNSLLQVEINTIAASFACLSTKLSNLHRFLSSRYTHINQTQLSSLPINSATQNLASGLAKAVHLFNSQTECTTSAVLMVVQDKERNSFDQRLLEYELWKEHKVKVIRKTLLQVYKEHKVDSKGILRFRSAHESTGGNCDVAVSVVYFRAGYTPRDYSGEEQWKAREILERSFAIKCPNIAYHLIGTKKVQQKLAKEGEVEKFMGTEDAALLRSSFTGLYSLDSEEQSEEEKQQEAKARTEEWCSGYVLKPQREGGGNNIYGRNIPIALANMTDKEKASYILMQRIFPKKNKVVLLKEGELVRGEGVSELGIYGVFLGNGSETVVNEYGGYLLRTKLEGVDEGGVAAGFSCLATIKLE